MRLLLRGTAWFASAAAVAALAGCTMFPDKQPATLAMTTSAERVNQIFWEDVSTAHLESADALLSPNVVWHRPEQTLRGKTAVAAYLEGAKTGTAQVSGPELLSNGDSITVLYTLQVNQNGAVRSRRVAAVWQHVPGKKANSPYLLTMMSEQPAQ